MPKVLWVAWREFKHTALTKAFVFGAVIVPLILIGLMLVIPVFFQPNITTLQGTMALVDSDGSVAEAARIELSRERMLARVARVLNQFDTAAVPGARDAIRSALPEVELTVNRYGQDADLEILKGRVRSGDLVALAVVPGAEERETGRAQSSNAEPIVLYLTEDLTPNHQQLLRDALRDAVVRARVQKQGGNLEELTSLLARPDIHSMTLTSAGTEAETLGELAFFLPLGFMMLIWIATFTSSQYLLTTTIEEKSNKVIEVLLSAVSPMQLMTGKIIGQAIVSFVMLIMYGGLAVAGLIAIGHLMQVPWINFVYLALYFVMAFFMIAAMMAGIGSAVNEMREAQSLIGPVMIVLMIPLVLWFIIQESPNGVLATVTSFIPPLIPFVMILRVTSLSEPVALWQIIVSLVWGFACTVGMIWLAAKVFRVGVLMYGKPPTPFELVKWVRYS